MLDTCRSAHRERNRRSTPSSYHLRYHGEVDAATLIRHRRTGAGLTQGELAERSGVRQPNIAAYELGTRVPSAAMVQRLLNAARRRPSVVLGERRAEVLALAEKHNASNVRVFGSVARQDDTVDSDVDLLVSFGPGTTLVDVGSLTRELEALLGSRVDIVDDVGIRGRRIEQRILQDSVPL